MHQSALKRVFVLAILGIVSLFLLGCSSQVPVSTTVGSAQVNGENTQAVEEVSNEIAGSEDVTEELSVDVPSIETQPTAATDSPTPAVVIEEAAAPAVIENALTESGPDQDQTKLDSAQVTTEATGIVVSGSGQASSAPDLATLRLGVQAIELTVGEARDTAAAAMTAVVNAVTEAGVEDKDVQTGYFSIQPRYTGREITRCIDAEGKEMEPGQAMAEIEDSREPGISLMPQAQECFQEYRSVITGYEVSNNLTVLVRNLESVDDVIDGAVDAGGDNIRFNGLNFSLDDTSELQSEARASAVLNLEEKAAELAGLAGVQLGDLVYLSESGGAPPPVFKAEFAVAQSAFAADRGVSTPISPGEISVSVTVVGQYQISTGE